MANDQPIVHNQAPVTTETLKQAGLSVQLDTDIWGALITRRSSKEPVDKSGWSLFHTWTAAPELLSPALSGPLRSNGDKARVGWPSDPKLEALIDAWFKAPDGLAIQTKIAGGIQSEAYAGVPDVPAGLFVIPAAYRGSLEGGIVSPVVFLWNIENK